MPTTATLAAVDENPRDLDAAILSYLDAHPSAVDSLRGIATWWLSDTQCDIAQVERALERLVARNLVERIRLADGTVVYGRAGGRGAQ